MKRLAELLRVGILLCNVVCTFAVLSALAAVDERMSFLQQPSCWQATSRDLDSVLQDIGRDHAIVGELGPTPSEATWFMYY